MRVILLSVMVFFIVVAHIFLWLSDMATPLKILFTAINALAWTVVLAPILLIDKWLETIKSRNRPDAEP